MRARASATAGDGAASAAAASCADAIDALATAAAIDAAARARAVIGRRGCRTVHPRSTDPPAWSRVAADAGEPSRAALEDPRSRLLPAVRRARRVAAPPARLRAAGDDRAHARSPR